MSLDQETINQQEALLQQHRRRLDVLLQQQTRLGDYAPPHVRLEIEDVQAVIQHLKLELRSMGVAVADEPNDTVQPATIAAPSRLSAQEQLNRSRMLDRVETFWVKGVLEQSLYQVARIELGFEHAPAQVSHPWETVIQQANQLNETIPPGKPVVAVFDDFLGELLILGAPGAGKTTTLLELSRDLIARARQNEQHPIPVVLNLSTWATKRQSLKLWLTEELNQRYDVPKKLAQEWVAGNPLLLLLDGLDEVTAEHRDACVEAINEYRTIEGGFVPLVVCSRIADYEGLRIKLRVQGAVVIQSLTKLQVDSYLKQIGRPLAAVRAALRDDTTLWELMDNPLMLSIVALAYKDTSAAKLRASGTLDERRQQLFDDYIAAMFARPGRSIKTAYTRHKTLFSLAWLARTMVEQKQTIIYIERMQPAWLHRLSGLGFAIRVGLLSALVFGLVGGLRGGLIGGLSGGLSSALVFGLIGGLVGGLSGYPAEIQPVETLRWSWSAAGGGRHSSLVFALIFGLGGGLGVGLSGGLSGGLIVGLIVGLIFGLIFGLVGWVLGWVVGEVTEGQITRRTIVDSRQFRRLVWYILAGGLGVGLPFGLGFASGIGLLFGPVGGPVGALIFVLATKEIPTQTVDRKSMRRAAWAGLVSGLLGGLVVGLLGWLNGGLVSDLGSSPIIGLLGGLLGGLAGITFGWLAGWLSGGRRTQPAISQNKALRRFARNALSGGLGSGLVVGLLGVLGGRPILGLLGGLAVGLLGGLGSGLLSGLIEGIAPTRTVTNEGIRRSLRSAVVGGLFSGLIVGLIVGLLFGLRSGLVNGLVVGLLFGLVGGLLGGLLYGGATVLQHYTLRWLLYRNSALPLRLVPFLDYCAERIFLRKVGGGYIFVHRLLMEHFAGFERGKAE